MGPIPTKESGIKVLWEAVMDYHDSVDWLKGEVARLKQLLEWEQNNHREFRSQMLSDPIIGEVFRLRGEIESRKSVEKDLLFALEEAEQELADLKATDDMLMDEAGI